METRANFVLIGAFVLMAAAALMLFTVWISREPFSRAHTLYDVVFEGPVNGLGEGGEVRFNGIKVGEVKRLSLDRKDPNRVIARISVDAQTPVRVDSVAELNFMGVTGVTFIQIRAGSPDKPMMPKPDNGQPAVIKAERTALDELFEGGQDLFTAVGDTIQSLNDILDETSVEDINAIIHNLRIASDKLARDGGLIDNAQVTIKKLDVAIDSIDAAAKSVETTAKDFDRDFGKLATDADHVLVQLDPVIAEAGTAMTSVSKAAAQVSDQLVPNAGQTLDAFANTATDLRALMVRLQGLVSEVEQDPSRFVYRQAQPVE